MNPTPDQIRLLTLCAIRIADKSPDWSLIARQAQDPGGLDLLYAGRITSQVKDLPTQLQLLQRGLDDFDEASRRVSAELDAAWEVGARLSTVLDDDYPANLRLVPNLPPFLFYRGELRSSDARSVAVVGTRNCTEPGVKRAARMAGALVDQDVTVTSGLAAGIDTVAHATTLERGGRTIAVIGTGITKCYPAQNAALAERIVDSGAVVSQFWPTARAAQWTFPRRNVVTSGISQGTVVVEASKTSGAKMQARLALEHGKLVFLMRALVTNELWAQGYLKRGAIEVAEVEDVIRHLASPERIHAVSEQRRQMVLDLAFG
jgi:DNA processing protein